MAQTVNDRTVITDKETIAMWARVVNTNIIYDHVANCVLHHIALYHSYIMYTYIINHTKHRPLTYSVVVFVTVLVCILCTSERERRGSKAIIYLYVAR